MICKKYFITFFLFLLCSLSQASIEQNIINQPQVINKNSNAPFLKPGDTVTVVGDNTKHNYVEDMETLDKDSLFRRHSILFVGGFLLISILLVIFIYFRISQRHVNQDGVIND